MTRIRMQWGKKFVLTAEGHANGGKAGADILCAAVSAITQTLAQRLYDTERTGGVIAEMRSDRARALTEIEALPRPGRRRQIREDFLLTMAGLKMLAKEYPENISIEEEETWQ